MNPVRLCTVCERKTLPSALVLADSVRRRHGEGSTCHVVIADEEGSPGPSASHVRLVAGHELGIEGFELLAAVHPAPALARALVPFALQRIGAPCMYLAPDAELIAPVEVPDVAVGVIARGTEGPPLLDDGFVSLLSPADELLEWWQERVRRDGLDQPWLDAALGRFGLIGMVRDAPLSMAAWNAADRATSSVDGLLADGRRIAWVRFDGLDADAAPPALQPLVVAHATRVARHSPAASPGYAAAADGTALDDRVRRLLGRAIREGALTRGPFEPRGWSEALIWLGDADPDPRSGAVGRLLYDIYRERDDLRYAYPRLEEPDIRDGLHGWMLVHGVRQHAIPTALLPDPPPELGLGTANENGRPPWGLNVAGYFQSELGMGEAARRVMEALDAVKVPALPVHSTVDPPSRRGEDYGSVPVHGAPYVANLVCVNADGLPGFVEDVGRDFMDRFSIGFWWWEVLDFPEPFHAAFDDIDEVWVGSRHVLEAISAAAPVPVVRVPLPVSLPPVQPISREALGLPDGTLFLFLFDFNSIMRRKNPIGLVEAFVRAFGPDAGASLVIKSINGDQHPEERERLRAAAGPHPQVKLIDRYVTSKERAAMIACCDAYVSLHRSEGFGLTLAEAMHLGRPVIATGYSGNLDFMDADTAWLVPHRLESVGLGAGPYPPDAVWADPDLDAAAAAMREVVDQPEEARARGRRAAAAIRRSHSPEAAGAAMSRRLETIRPRIYDRVRPTAPRRSLRARFGGLVHRARTDGRPAASGGSGKPELAAYAALLAQLRHQDARLGAIERRLSSGAEERE